MNCEEIQNKLSLLIDGRLDEKEQVSVNHHLEDCPVCREYYRKLLKLESMADEFEVGGDEDYWISQKNAILDRIEQAESKQVTPIPARRSRDLFYRIAAVAAAVALVASISIFESRQVEPVKGIFHRDEASRKISTIAGNDKAPAIQEMKEEAGKGAQETVSEEETEDTIGPIARETRGEQKKGKPLPKEAAEGVPEVEVAPTKDVIDFDTEMRQKEDQEDLDKIISIPLPSVPQADEFTAPMEIAPEKSEIKPREIVGEEIPEHATGVEKGGSEADQVEGTPVEGETESNQKSIFKSEEKPATSLVQEMKFGADSESQEYSDVLDSIKVQDLKKAVGIAAQESAKPQIETPLIDVDEPVLGVTRASLDPSVFGDFTEEQKQQYVDLRNKADWYNTEYAFIYSQPSDKIGARSSVNYSSPNAEKMAEVPPTKLSRDSLQVIADSMADVFYGLGVMTPIKDECSRMLDLMKKLRKRADEKLTTKLDNYIGELENRLD